MNTWIWAAALLTVAAAPAEAGHMKSHRAIRHHAHPDAATYPDSVMLDGKSYKVCKPGIEDDCVEPRQAGLGFGNRPTDVYRPHRDSHR